MTVSSYQDYSKKIVFKKGFQLVKYLFFLILTCGLSATSLPPSVLVTIKPIHSLVIRLMEGRGIPDLLLDGSQSPHHVTLTPSQRQALQNSSLVVWIGPSFEMFLSPWMTRTTTSQKLTLLEQPGLQLLPQACNHTEKPSHHVMDGHIWMDPYNTIQLVRCITQKLIAVDPSGRSLYEANLKKLERDLKTWDQEIQETLRPCHQKIFAVTHQAYGYFVKRYGLQQPIAIFEHPEKGGTCPHDLYELAHFLRQHPGGCVFFEPQFRNLTTPLKDFVLKRGGRVAEMDPLGACESPGVNLYPRLLKRCAQALRDNLRPLLSSKEPTHAPPAP